MKNILSVFIIILVIACQNESDEAPQSADLIPAAETFTPSSEFEYNFSNWQTFTNRRFHFSLEYPEQWWIAENKGELGPSVINLYNAAYDEYFELPLTINEDPRVSHISFFPEGFGISKPTGTVVPIGEVDISITFAPDSMNSVAYQLNDGEVWGYLLKPKVLPPGWSRDGYIFVQISVQDLQLKCFDASGKEKAVGSCNPIDGGDRIIKYGTVDKTDRQLINQMLSTIYFTDSENNRRPIAELIQVGELSANDTIKSPVVITGNARGVWFFEGSFPVILKDKNHQILTQTSAIATENWMTSGLVPFESSITFNSSASGQGYLVFKASNASGQSENERGYILPVILSGQ